MLRQADTDKKPPPPTGGNSPMEEPRKEVNNYDRKESWARLFFYCGDP